MVEDPVGESQQHTFRTKGLKTGLRAIKGSLLPVSYEYQLLDAKKPPHGLPPPSHDQGLLRAVRGCQGPTCREAGLEYGQGQPPPDKAQ